MTAPVGAGGRTRTSAESAHALFRAMMWVEPMDTAVTVPASLTVATAVLVDVQLTVGDATGRPASSLTVTCNARVAPGVSSTTLGVTRSSFAPIGGALFRLASSPQAVMIVSRITRASFGMPVTSRLAWKSSQNLPGHRASRFPNPCQRSVTFTDSNSRRTSMGSDPIELIERVAQTLSWN